MAAYNTAAYLDDAVGSILGQTFRNFEFIIVNNGSTDETAAILEKYRMRDSRIRLFYHEQQGSTYPSAFFKGVKTFWSDRFRSPGNDPRSRMSSQLAQG
jgi:GT2 family glycosyltransferase